MFSMDITHRLKSAIRHVTCSILDNAHRIVEIRMHLILQLLCVGATRLVRYHQKDQFGIPGVSVINLTTL